MSLNHTCFLLFCNCICRLRNLWKFFFSGRKKILIIKNDGLGDMLLFLPYLKQIQYWADENSYDVTLVAAPVVGPILNRLDFKGKVITPPSYRSFLKWFIFRFCFLLRNHADIVIKAQCMPSDFMDLYTPEKLISCGIRSLNMPCTVDIEGKSVIHWNEEIIQQLGVTKHKGKEIDYNVFCAPIRDWFRIPKYYIAVCPDASDLCRCWEKEKFIRLLDHLINEFSFPIVLVGTDEKYGQLLKNQCYNRGQIINLCGKTTVLEVFSICKDAYFLVSNETGTAHIGALIGTKTFIICGKGHYGMFVPYGLGKEGSQVFSIFSSYPCTNCNWLNENCKKSGTYKCISNISVEQVFTKICSKIASPTPRQQFLSRQQHSLFGGSPDENHNRLKSQFKECSY